MAKTLLNTPCNSEAKKENVNTFDSIKCKTVPIACKIHPKETKKTTSNLSLKTDFWKYLFHDQLKSIKPNRKMIWVCEQEIQVANIPSERWSSYNFRVQIKTIRVFLPILFAKMKKLKRVVWKQKCISESKN